jgi:hypothetical protein
MSKGFYQAKAFMDALRYEEADRLFKEVFRMEKEAKNYSHEADGIWWHKHEDRALTHEEVYRRALDDVMNLIDERLGALSAS